MNVKHGKNIWTPSSAIRAACPSECSYAKSNSNCTVGKRCTRICLHMQTKKRVSYGWCENLAIKHKNDPNAAIHEGKRASQGTNNPKVYSTSLRV